MLQRIIVVLLLLLSLSVLVPSIQAQEEIAYTIEPVEYVFGDYFTFRIKLATSNTPISVNLFLQTSDNQNAVTIETTSLIHGIYETTISPEDYAIHPFTEITYWFSIIMPDGETIKSQKSTLQVLDNRFDWKKLENSLYTIHWYKGDIEFAQAILNTANETNQRINELIPISINRKINIYIYNSLEDMQKTIQYAHADLVAGLASPDLMVVAVTISQQTNRDLEIKREIPHELMHIYLYVLMGEQYNNIPVWLNEGLASSMELIPNPDYDYILKDAFESKTLIPISDLCSSFPGDSSNFLLAYAESTSFVRYLISNTNPIGIQALLGAYKKNPDCLGSFKNGLGTTLFEAEREWRRETFKENSLMTTIKGQLPWLILFIIVFFTPLTIALFNLKRNKDD